MSAIGSLFAHEAAVAFWGLKLDLWDLLGFVAQGMFFSRFLFQWLASERRGHSYVPVYFWWISLGGALLLLVYLFGLERPPVPIILGQGVGLFVYSRNLVLIRRKRRLDKAAAVEAGDSLYVHPDRDSSDKHPDDAAGRG